MVGVADRGDDIVFGLGPGGHEQVLAFGGQQHPLAVEAFDLDRQGQGDLLATAFHLWLIQTRRCDAGLVFCFCVRPKSCALQVVIRSALSSRAS